MSDLKHRVSQVEGKLVHKLDGETMVIEAWGRDGLRVRVTQGPEILDTAWAMTEPVDASATIEICETEAVIRNGKISARIHDIRTAEWVLRVLPPFRYVGIGGGENMHPERTGLCCQRPQSRHPNI